MKPHMGERLFSDEGLAVLLLNIENGVAGLKWYRQFISPHFVIVFLLPRVGPWYAGCAARGQLYRTWQSRSQISVQRRDQFFNNLHCDISSESLSWCQLVNLHPTRSKKFCQHLVIVPYDAYLYRILTVMKSMSLPLNEILSNSKLFFFHIN